MRSVTLVLGLSLSACGAVEVAPAPRALDPHCPSFAAGREVGRVQSSALGEISGVVASRAQSGVLWVHDDSGTGALLFAIDAGGRLLGEWTLLGAPSIDWEDIALEVIPSGPDRLWIGDVGDNGARDGSAPPRDQVQIIRIDEPEIDRGRVPIAETRTSFEVLTLRYPDRPHDSEAITIDPSTGDLLLFAKESAGPSDVYLVPAPIAAGAEIVLQQIGTIHAGSMVTAADVSPDGRELLIRTYRSVLHWAREDGEPWSVALRRIPRQLPRAPEAQGEAIAWTSDATGYITIGEGANVPIWLYARDCE